MVKQNNKKGGLAGKQGLFIIYFRFLHSIINDLLRRYHYVFISAINERYADAFCRRVSELAVKLAVLCGEPVVNQTKISVVAIYHDIGKIKLPEEILNKKEPLTDEEYNLIKQHTNFGSVLMKGYCSDDICQMIQYHHENIDGSGYYRLTEIPLGSRIIRICDVYDAMTSIRPYHTGKSIDETMNYIRSHAGILFDESLVQLFSIIIQRKKEI